MRCTLSASQPAPPARVHAVRPERGAPAPSAAAACEALWNVSRARALAHPWLRALVAQVCALGPPGLAAQKKKILKSQCPNNLLHKCPCKQYF